MEQVEHAKLYLLFTPALCANDPWRTLEQALLGGVDLVQWRVSPTDREGLRRCLQVCGEHEVPVVVNDQVELAKEFPVIGAHIGQGDIEPAQARSLLGPEMVLGVSTHDLDQIAEATATGADHLGFGPIFPTTTKGYSEGLGSAALKRVLNASPLPIFPIGGIDEDNLDAVLAVGAERIAVSSVILTSTDPRAVAERLLTRLPE